MSKTNALLPIAGIQNISNGCQKSESAHFRLTNQTELDCRQITISIYIRPSSVCQLYPTLLKLNYQKAGQFVVACVRFLHPYRPIECAFVGTVWSIFKTSCHGQSRTMYSGRPEREHLVRDSSCALVSCRNVY